MTRSWVPGSNRLEQAGDVLRAGAGPDSEEDRDALIAGEPDLFFLPEPSDLRFNWVCCHLARLDPEYMTELVTEAWRMVVPKFLARQRLGS